ncbi:MAG: hypothetical protein AABW65_00870 [Nanoarchaeota archaeon]
MELREDDVVMCTVKSIEGTTVFLKIDGNGEGSIFMSEVAAGRIRNIREYVYPNKKIVCKVLKIASGHIQLSLRRVTAKERESVQERYKKERTFINMLKTVFPNYEELILKIKEKYDVVEFFDAIRGEPELLNNFMGKQDAQNISKLLLEKKEKEKKVKKMIILKSFSDSGIKDIKEILNIKKASIKYLGSSVFSVSTKAIDFKEAEHLLDESIMQIEKRAKERKALFEVKEK